MVISLFLIPLKYREMPTKSLTLEKNPQFLRWCHEIFCSSCRYPKPQVYQIWTKSWDIFRENKLVKTYKNRCCLLFSLQTFLCLWFEVIFKKVKSTCNSFQVKLFGWQCRMSSDSEQTLAGLFSKDLVNKGFSCCLYFYAASAQWLGGLQ